MTPTSVQDEATMQRARRAMVDNQIRTFDVTDQRVLEAFETVPRERFLPPALADLAYSDAVLTVTGADGTRRAMPVPLILARMIQGVLPDPGAKVLVVGDGTGYAAAVLAKLCRHVVALESDAGFVESARTNAYAVGAANVESVQGALELGHAAAAPYDIILICGAVEEEPEALLRQLAPGGRLCTVLVDTSTGARPVGKVLRYDFNGRDVSFRSLFSATTATLDSFRRPAAFVF